MLTFVQIINRVLRRIREDQVSNYNDSDYSELVGDFVNETIAEIQDRTEWDVFNTEIEVTTDGSSLVYDVTGTHSGTRIIGVYNDTDDWDLIKQPYQRLTRDLLYRDSDPTDVLYYREKGVSATGERRIEVDADITSKTLKVAVYNPHDDIATSSTLVKLSAPVVIAGALWRAVDERGDDSGTAAQTRFNTYKTLLGNAITLERSRLTNAETDWEIE